MGCGKGREMGIAPPPRTGWYTQSRSEREGNACNDAFFFFAIPLPNWASKIQSALKCLAVRTILSESRHVTGCACHGFCLRKWHHLLRDENGKQEMKRVAQNRKTIIMRCLDFARLILSLHMATMQRKPCVNLFKSSGRKKTFQNCVEWISQSIRFYNTVIALATNHNWYAMTVVER